MSFVYYYSCHVYCRALCTVDSPIAPKPDGSETGKMGGKVGGSIWDFMCSGALKNLYMRD